MSAAFGEEAGWRGYALPRLPARSGSLRGTLILASRTTAADGVIAALGTAAVIGCAAWQVQRGRAGKAVLGWPPGSSGRARERAGATP